MNNMRSKLKHLFVTLPMMLVALMASGQSCPDNNHPHAIDLGLPSGHLTSWHLHHQRQESGCEVRIMPQKY